MPVGQVAVVCFSDQPGDQFIGSGSDRERLTDPAIQPGVVQRPGGGVDQVGEFTTRSSETTAEGIVDAHGRWRSLRRTHGTNVEQPTDTF